MNKRLGALAILGVSALVLAGCTSTPATTDPTGDASAPAGGEGQNITMWVMGGDTPAALREYLQAEYTAATGGELKIEEQSWGDALTKLNSQLPDANNTPDVVEIGNTWSPTFTTVGAFSDLSDMYEELGGEDLLQSFVDVGEVDGKQYALPYYFGSRYITYRKDVWAAAGVEVPKTLDEFNAAVAKLKTPTQAGFYIGGEDWRNAVSWVFANGGELAVLDGDTWKGALSSPETQEGLKQFQELFTSASTAPVTEDDSTPWININNDKSGAAPTAATIIAPGWAHWSIGDFTEEKENEDGTMSEVRTWNDDVFGVFPLPGNDGKPAPVFAGGSNLAISAKSQNQEGARELLKIIYSDEYQQMLGENGLGPANTSFVSSLGDDIFATALIDSALNSKLTPAAPGWAAVEGQRILEEFFGKVAGGGDIAALAAEYDAKIDAVING